MKPSLAVKNARECQKIADKYSQTHTARLIFGRTKPQNGQVFDSLYPLGYNGTLIELVKLALLVLILT